MKCPNCYTELPDTATICYKCMKPVLYNQEIEKQPCPNCGALLPKTAKECYVCHIKFSQGNKTEQTTTQEHNVEKENGFSTTNKNDNLHKPGYKPYTRVAQNNTKPVKKKNGCIVKIGGTFLLILLIGGLLLKFNNKDIDEPIEDTTSVWVDNTEGTEENTSEKVGQIEESELDKMVASDLKNMKVGDVGKDNDVYFCLVHMKKSNELAHEVANLEYTDENHDIVFAFIDIYNNSEKVVSMYNNKFSCYVDNIKVDRMDTNFYVMEDGVKELRHYNLDPHTSELLLLQYEIPKDCKEIKIYYESSCVWKEDYSSLTEDAYNGEKPLMQIVKNENTPIGNIAVSGGYNLAFDGTDYYTTDKYGIHKEYIIFKYTINAKSKMIIPSGHYMRCYQNGYLVLCQDLAQNKMRSSAS